MKANLVIMSLCIAISGCGVGERTGNDSAESEGEAPKALGMQATAKAVADEVSQVLGQFNEPKWVFDATESDVTGKEYTATFRNQVEGVPGASTVLEVKCRADSNELSTTYTLLPGDAAQFVFSQAGAVNGFVKMQEMKKAVRARPATVKAFRNQAVLNWGASLKQSDDPEDYDYASYYKKRLPIAVALESSFGTVEFVVPRRDEILALVDECVNESRIDEVKRALIYQTEADDAAKREAEAPNTVSVIYVGLSNLGGAPASYVFPTIGHISVDVTTRTAKTSEPVPGRLGARWLYEDGTIVNEETQEFKFLGADTATFRIDNSDEWPTGRYSVEISLDGDVVERRAFEVR